MPRFSIKDLLVSTTLVAVGLAGIVVVVNHWPSGPTWSDAVLFISGNALIGAGILGRAKKPWIGALLGATIGLIGVVAVMIHTFNVLMRM
ncbi:MAG: hypothetical protein L0228_12185 [Planctomycetes bacterium]|nr:hypothetical protein [Planctomycetota bacterium]